MNEIWNAFLALPTEKIEKFQKRCGLLPSDIEAIGVEKFIEAIGWTSEDQVGSFETDKLVVSVCPNCLSDFGLYPIHFGICKNCQPNVDVRSLTAIIQSEKICADLLNLESQDAIVLATQLLKNRAAERFFPKNDTTPLVIAGYISEILTPLSTEVTRDNSNINTTKDFILNYPVPGKPHLEMWQLGLVEEVIKLLQDNVLKMHPDLKATDNIHPYTWHIAITKYASDIILAS